MKYLVVLGDGMADEPLAELDNRTPLEAASTPFMDELASKGTMGLVKTVPEGMKPGSDVANLAVLGYNPKLNYSGRSPLEALSVGVEMDVTDIIFRSNIVTLSEEEGIPYAERTILDHSSGEISTQDADVLMDAIREAFNDDEFAFYTGTSYRHILVWKNGRMPELEAPHDHLGSVIGEYLPKEEKLRAMMEKSFDILNNHPINLARAAAGLNKANSLWFWGAGTKPAVGDFTEKTGHRGAMISAVDLLKGIAVGAHMDVIQVEGANGGLHTNYRGKAMAAVDALCAGPDDFAYIHVEAPDEMGHMGSIEHKIEAIEALDREVVGTVLRELRSRGEAFRILLMPDHPTPIRCRTHTSDAVPFVLYDSTKEQRKIARYSEKEAAETGEFIAEGFTLIDRLFAE